MPLSQTSLKNLIIVFLMTLGMLTASVWAFVMPPADILRWVIDPRDNHEKVNNGLLSDDEKRKELKAEIKVLNGQLELSENKRIQSEQEALLNHLHEKNILENKISDLIISKEKTSKENRNQEKIIRENEQEISSLNRKNREVLQLLSNKREGSLSGKNVGIYYLDDVAAEAILLEGEIKKLGGEVVLNIGDGGYNKNRYIYYLNGENLNAANCLFSSLPKDFSIKGMCANYQSNKYDLVIVLK